MGKKLQVLGLVGLMMAAACSGKSETGGGGTNGGNAASGGGEPGGLGGRAGVSMGNGAGGAPSTSHEPVDKIDLLFMVDNSLAMGDKQALLGQAVPELLTRLATPRCVDADDQATGKNVDADGKCPTGSEPEFVPINDIHIGIVSSSLGAHGGFVCSQPMTSNDTLDDRAHLIASERVGVVNWNDSGFLAWDPKQTAQPPGEQDLGSLNDTFTNMMGSVGEHGCGFEASLESWYRFLIDPEPPESVVKDSSSNTTVRSSAITVDADNKVVLDATTGKPVCTGCDTTLLAQRAAFLRPDSLVAIVMLSDENDCSIRDDGVGWFVGANARMPRSSSTCESAPNDPCCRSCALSEGTPPTGCVPLSNDSVCKMTDAVQGYAIWDAEHDSLNLRCYDQHQRFGFDLLYETSRYVQALTQRSLTLQSNPNVSVTNPLFDTPDPNMRPRDPSLVWLAGIVGVPWQDIADDASLTGSGLTYLTSQELLDRGRWDYLLGSPDKNPVVPPLDPFMIETPQERSGVNTIAQVEIVPSNSTNPRANVINGHEQAIPELNDLQYACIFELPKPKPCQPADAACNCAPSAAGDPSAVTAANSPVCQPPGGGAAQTTQYFAKAYPGVRELTVLKDLGANAIVTSICPKVMSPSDDPNYGYTPAMSAIVDRLREALPR